MFTVKSYHFISLCAIKNLQFFEDKKAAIFHCGLNGDKYQYDYESQTIHYLKFGDCILPEFFHIRG